MPLATTIEAYVHVLARWGPHAAFHGCHMLMARDSESRWWEEEN